MFCENCGTKLADDAQFCEVCGARQSQVQADQKPQMQPGPIQTREVIGQIPPTEKKRWPIVLSIVIAVVLVLSAAGALAYRFVIAPASEGGGLIAGLGKKNMEKASIVDIMEMTGESLRAIEGFSGANFDLKVRGDGESIGANGFFKLGDDLWDSVGYIKLSAMGESYEAALTEGTLIYDDDGSVYSMSLSDLNVIPGFDLNDFVKDGAINTEAITELMEEAYGMSGMDSVTEVPNVIGGLMLSEGPWDEFDRSWRKYLQDNADARDKAFTVRSQSNERIEYQIHTEEFYDLFFDYLNDLANNGSDESAEMAEDLLELLNSSEVEDAIEEISDITVILELNRGKLKSMDAGFSVMNNRVSFSLELNGQYLSGIGFVISGDTDVSASLEIKNHNNPRINNSLINSLEDRALAEYWEETREDDNPYGEGVGDAYVPSVHNEPYKPAAQDGYLFPSDTQYITEAYLRTLTRDEVALIRNEIYARHGYIFKTEKYQQYFGEKSWYVPDPNFNASSFSAIESANVKTITSYEERMGWR